MVLTNLEGKDNTKVSIITVCFNSDTTIKDTIESVINQTHPNIEYIIIDGGSTDSTIDIIKKYENHITKWISEPDEGIYDAMNKGIEMASGELIGLLNSDDTYNPESVQIVVSHYLKNPAADVFHGDVSMYDFSNNFLFRVKPSNNFNDIWHNMIINHPGTFISKKVYLTYGVYSLDYKLAADYELILRFYLKDVKFHYINNVLAFMRIGGIGEQEVFKSCKEFKSITIKYGFPKTLANLSYLYKICKISLKRILEKCNISIIVKFKRLFSSRTTYTK